MSLLEFLTLSERFGGTLHAENRPEGGARLRVELPIHVQQLAGAMA